VSQKDVTGSDLTPTGYFYRMLGNALEGTQLVNRDGDFKVLENGTEVGLTYTFDRA
jgi:hypothetical protein